MNKVANILCVITALLLIGSASLYGGQNASAVITIDLDWMTGGNQGVTSMSPPGVGVNVTFEVRIDNASNLDTYEFDLLYQDSELSYVNAWADNMLSAENNILKKHGADVVGPIVDTSVPGVVNFSLTNNTNDPLLCPEGEGLLAVIRLQTKVSGPGTISFGNVTLIDNGGDPDSPASTGDASLPVTMTDMNATADKQNGVTISWQTESELDCSGFHLLKSTDNVSYERITTKIIESQGNGSTIQLYEFIDRNVEDKKLYWYKIEEITTKGMSILYGPLTVEGISPIPTEFDLSHNYPNPFNPKTTLKYQLPEDCDVAIRVFNLLGKEVRSLYDENQKAGYYSIEWSGFDNEGQMMPSGIYIIQMIAGDFHQVRKINLMR